MQYLVSVIDDRTNSGTAEEAVAIDEFNERLQTGGHWVFAGGLAAPEHLDGHRRPRRRAGVHRRARSSSRRSTSPASGSSTPPTSTSRSRSWPTGRRPATGGSRCGRSWPVTDARRVTRAHRERVGPGGRHARPAVRRPRHRRGGGGRGVRDRRRAVAGRRRPAQPRRVADHDRQPQGDRPDPAREQARRQAPGGADAVRRRPARAARRHRRRPAPADLHLLPPGPRDGGAGRPDAADGRRADRARDRARASWCRRPRWASGSPARRPRSPPRASRTGCRPRSDLPARVTGVLAVLFLVFNEGYLATGPDTDPVRADLTAEAIRLTRLVRTLLPEDGEVAGLLALMLLTEARRPARVSADGALVTLARAGPRRLGRRADRRGAPPGARAAGLRRRPRSLPAARRDQRRAHRRARRPRHRLVAGRRPVRPAGRASTARRSSPSTAPSPSPRSTVRTSRSPPSTGSATRSTGTTRSTPPAPSCCAGWTAAPRPARPTTGPSRSPATPPRPRYLTRRRDELG